MLCQFLAERRFPHLRKLHPRLSDRELRAKALAIVKASRISTDRD